MTTKTRTNKLIIGKLNLEFKTVHAMVVIYCKKHHLQNKGLCPTCKTFLDYAHEKLDRCPYGEAKPTCNKCPIHCYKKTEREQARTIMRYAGPRMLLKHPILALKHMKAVKAPVPETIPIKMSNRHIRKQQTEQ